MLRQRREQPSLGIDLQSEGESAQTIQPEWLSTLRHELVDAGHDAAQVDALLTAAVERFRSGRVREYVPLLVERSVYRELRGR
jgi:hypothetical protein